MDTVVFVSIIAVFLGLLYVLLRPSIKVYHKVQTGEKFASLVYTDETGGKLLVSEEWDLQGKPDYIFKKWFRNQYIPLEIKSGKAKEDWPHEGDLMQLLAYFILVEEAYGTRPPYGAGWFIVIKPLKYVIHANIAISSKKGLEEMCRCLINMVEVQYDEELLEM